ncbi:hypothetical protein LWH94_18770 [Marinobacter sp. G11]|uniref:lipopolysaccharide biosynthesis protein n=1 Tax=Marinobacter sp. G11 TaxID=2903522 RepID=UPI001E5B2EE8|nr:hypothetical protein [Marinobacter sp. G11]MCE0761215.1 hypothetical protein [Marinobacter sp. G11]
MSIRGRFLKLLFGPVVTLVVGVLSGPLISRLYTPEEFGRYSVLLGVVGIGVVVVTVRFEQLIPTSKDPASSFWISLVCSIAGAVLLGCVAYLFVSLEETLFIIFATMAVAIFNGFYYLLVNAGHPLRASSGRAVQAGGVLGGQAMFGAAGWGMLGLMWGELSGRLISLVFVFRKVQFHGVSVIKREFFAQWPAAKWLLPGALSGAIALQLLPLGMAVSVGAAAAGIFLLIYRMVVIPNSLLSKVASDTLLIELSRLEKNGLPICGAVEIGLGKLLLAATCLYGTLAVYGGWLFSILLGDQWSASAELIPWLAIFVGFWSLASPLAMVFVAMKKTRWSFGLSFLDVANRCVALVVGFVYQDVLNATISLALGGAVVYGTTVACALRLANADFVRAVSPMLLSATVVISLLVLSGLLFARDAWIASLFLTVIAFGVSGKKVVYG